MAHQPQSSGRFIASFCLIAGLVIGLLLGRHSQSPSNSASPRTGSERSEVAFAHSKGLRDTPLDAVATDKPPATSGIEHFRKLANSGPPYDMELALRSARELSNTVECREVMELFRRWPSEERQVLQRAIARRWAGLDPDGALRKSLRSPNDDFHRLLVEEAARELVRRDPDAAMARLSDPMTALQRVMLGHFMLPALAEKNPAKAAAFLAANKEFMVDDDMFGNVARLWARENPKDALAWAMALPQGRAQAKALQEIWTTWSAQDPVVVAAEINRNADGKVGLEVFRAVAQVWSRIDPRAALEWIAGLSPTRADEALRAFSLDVRKLGAESTLQLINSIKSESQQARVAGEVAAQLAADNRRHRHRVGGAITERRFARSSIASGLG
jgi:hypothetical protein